METENIKRELAAQMQEKKLTFNPNWLDIEAATTPEAVDHLAEAAVESAVEEIAEGFSDQATVAGKVKIWIDETVRCVPDYLLRT